MHLGVCSSPYPPYTLSATMGITKADAAAAQAMGKCTTRGDTAKDPQARQDMAARALNPLPCENRLHPGQAVLSNSEQWANFKANKANGASAEKALVARTRAQVTARPVLRASAARSLL